MADNQIEECTNIRNFTCLKLFRQICIKCTNVDLNELNVERFFFMVE